MIYTVRGVSLIRETGEQEAPPRDEDIDTETNELFMGATGPWDVEDRYLAFWNRLNDNWEEHPPPARVVVLSVTRKE